MEWPSVFGSARQFCWLGLHSLRCLWLAACQRGNSISKDELPFSWDSRANRLGIPHPQEVSPGCSHGGSYRVPRAAREQAPMHKTVKALAWVRFVPIQMAKAIIWPSPESMKSCKSYGKVMWLDSRGKEIVSGHICSLLLMEKCNTPCSPKEGRK